MKSTVSKNTAATKQQPSPINRIIFHPPTKSNLHAVNPFLRYYNGTSENGTNSIQGSDLESIRGPPCFNQQQQSDKGYSDDEEDITVPDEYDDLTVPSQAQISQSDQDIYEVQVRLRGSSGNTYSFANQDSQIGTFKNSNFNSQLDQQSQITKSLCHNTRADAQKFQSAKISQIQEYLKEYDLTEQKFMKIVNNNSQTQELGNSYQSNQQIKQQQYMTVDSGSTGQQIVQKEVIPEEEDGDTQESRKDSTTQFYPAREILTERQSNILLLIFISRSSNKQVQVQDRLLVIQTLLRKQFNFQKNSAFNIHIYSQFSQNLFQYQEEESRFILTCKQNRMLPWSQQ
eukprot:403375015